MRRLSPSEIRETLLTVALFALEAAPVQAWLIVYAAAEVGDIRTTAAPFWLVAAIVVVYAGARRWLARVAPGALLGAWVVLAICSLFALARFSPLMYGIPAYPFNSISWLNALYAGQFSNSALFAFCALVVYLGWRGTAVGKRVNGFLQVSRRFWIGLGALALAIFGSLATPAAFRDQVSAELIALLALEGFAGLTALALARPLGGASRSDALTLGVVDHSFRWHALSVMMSFTIMLGVILISALLNLGAAHELLAYLGPVGAALNAVSEWATLAIAYLLYLLTVAWISKLFKPSLSKPPVNPPHGPNGIGKRLPAPHVPAGFGAAATVIVALLAVALVALTLYLVARAIASARDKGDDEALDEERESLEVQSVLGLQVRALADWWRNRGRRAEPDPLRRAGTRWHYREVMRAGARAGIERAANETASEYTGRLASALTRGASAPAVVTDLSAVARDYEDARYGGETDDDPAASVAVASRAREVTERINALRKSATRTR